MRAMSTPVAPKLVKVLETRHGPMLALPQDQFVTQCLETYGEFSPGEWRLLAQIIKPGMVVVEVGANIGAHTVAMAQACWPAMMYAFEPQRRVFQILCANLALNDVENVVARQEACGAEEGVATIPPLNYAAAGNFGGVSLRTEDQAGERVRVVRLDDLNLTGCGLIKIDVEGFEQQVIAGAAHTIQRHRPILYVENDRREHQRALIAQIDALGYRLYWHTPPLIEVPNFRGETKSVFDKIVLSINMLCLPKERGTKTDLEPIDPADPHVAARLGGGPAGG
jgi:FkbM family methyltransferase